jgi:endonuclease/exonuclease/phosphatase family metal-dependent hydrolase
MVLRGASLALVLTLAVGCATARNYEDPARPLYKGGTATVPPPEPTLRVVTFNLKWGRYVDRAAELFSRPGPLHDADLIVLEEMDRPGTERLARELGLSWVYVPSAVHPVPDHDFGVALLSPWPLENPRKLLLPHLSRFRKMRRSATVATLRSPIGPVRVYGVHLESFSGASGKVRREQTQAVLADAAAWKGAVVVAGDFNGRGGARVMSGAGFEWATEPVKNTAGPFDFDHILARGLCPAAIPAAGRADDATDASDHDPVWAVFRTCSPAPARATAGS